MAATGSTSTPSSSKPSKEDTWMVFIDQEIQELAKMRMNNVRPVPKAECNIFRVQKQVKNLKKESFNPDLMFLGLLNMNNTLDRKGDKGEKFKIEMAEAFLETVNSKEDSIYRRKGLRKKTRRRTKKEVLNAKETGKEVKWDWEKLCQQVVTNHVEIQEHYDLDERISERVVRFKLTLDAIFLASYLGAYLFRGEDLSKFPFPLLHQLSNSRGLSFHNTVLNDITKVENQIPLSLIRSVLKILHRGRESEADDVLNEMCYKWVRTMSPSLPGFSADPSTMKSFAFLNCDHLLECLCSVMRGGDRESDNAAPPAYKHVQWPCSLWQGRNLNSCCSWDMCTEEATDAQEMHGDYSGAQTDDRSNPIAATASNRNMHACSSSINPNRPSNWERIFRGVKFEFTATKDSQLSPRPATDVTYDGDVAIAPADLDWEEISLPTATKLHDAGISFRGLGHDANLKGTSDLVPTFKLGLFKVHATLLIPSFAIVERTELVWRNMVAYDHHGYGLTRELEGGAAQFIYFLKFMDEMIDTQEDVWLLRKGRKPVINKNLLGTDQDVAELFNSIVQYHTMDELPPPNWRILRDQIDRFVKDKYRQDFLECFRYSCGKPWLVISLVTAFLILLMTFLQTIYTVM